MIVPRLVALVALATIVVGPAIAGEPERCSGKLEVCIAMISAKMKASGWVGVELDIDMASGLYRVVKVIPDSPAEGAGFRPGDLFKAVNGTPMSSCKGKSLEEARKLWKPGQLVTYTINRDGVDLELEVTLVPMPANIMARYIGQHTLMHKEDETEAP